MEYSEMDSIFNHIKGRYAMEKKSILAYSSTHDSFAITELAKELGTSIPKVTRILNEMIQEGLLAESGKLESATGRRPCLYGLNPDAGLFVGVDVGRDSLMVAVTNFSGRIVCIVEDILFVLQNTEDSVQALCQTVQEQLAAAGVDQDKIHGYGVNLTGRVNHRTGYSYSYFMGEDKPISQLFEKYFGHHVLVENDSRAMAYGEYVNSFSGTEGNILFLNVGWGLGMGMVMDGKLYYGKSGFSGEIGHFPLLDNNRVCHCGKVGCLETGASGSALHRIVMEKLRQGRSSLLTKAFADGETISLDSIMDAIGREDVLCIECVEEVGATLGRAVAGLINIFNPDIVVIGGRLSVTEHYLMPPLRSSVNKLSLNLVNNDTVIKVSRLGKTAGAIGASYLSKHQLLNQA